MKTQLLLVAAALVVVLVLAAQLAHATAGPGPRDPQDSLPAWSSDGTRLAFGREVGGRQRVLEMTAGGKGMFVAAQSGVLRGWVPGTRYTLIQLGGETLVTAGGRFDAPYATLPGVDASASPDGTRVAYVRGDDLFVSALDGSGERLASHGVAPPSNDVVGPAWSPDGTRIVAASAGGLVLADADGSGSRVLVHGDDANPTWSPDGASVAYQQRDEPYDQIWAVDADGTDVRRLLGGAANYRFPQYSSRGELAYVSDRQHVRGGATPYRYALYVGTTKLLDDVHPLSPPRWSPNGSLLAASAGQECRRRGVYVGRTGFARRSNICRFTGTSGADRIGGSEYFDLIRGLGGSDVVRGRGGNDRIEGNGGHDRIAAGAGDDVVFGGPGDDRLYGGPGDDVLIGGAGRDVIDCGPGDDTVQGVSRLDVVARNCEHVRR
ncbi:MAG TPA: hypothetical protein VFL60_07730 [Gaiellaceae bacterium]|nr:hypothetical protein [Gaiellaceae bacterium]